MLYSNKCKSVASSFGVPKPLLDIMLKFKRGILTIYWKGDSFRS